MNTPAARNTKRVAPGKRRGWLWIPGVILAVIIVLLLPWDVGALDSHPAPVTTYDEAVQRLASMRSDEVSKLNPDCLVDFMDHGQSVEHVIVLVHGYTSCPKQFEPLGAKFFDLGYNVLIVPQPHHGLPDRLNTEQSQLGAQELAAYADQVLDIAHGLGKRITIAGISGGGVISAWAAQNRTDVETALLISPAFGFKQIPTPLTAAAMNIFRILPNSFTWWDPAKKEEGGPSYAYPRYSTRALVEYMRLGFAVQAAARLNAPAARQIIVVTNGNEPSVNNELTLQVANLWRDKGGDVSFYEFPVGLKLPHDLIDPSQTDQNIDVVYPALLDLATGRAPAVVP